MPEACFRHEWGTEMPKEQLLEMVLMFYQASQLPRKLAKVLYSNQVPESVSGIQSSTLLIIFSCDSDVAKT